MKTFFKFLGVYAILLVVVVAGAMTHVKTILPDVVPAPELAVERTPERVARGEYLANHIMLCMDCHTVRDFSIRVRQAQEAMFLINALDFLENLLPAISLHTE